MNGWLEVVAQAGQVAVILTVENPGPQAGCLPRELAEDEILFGPYLVVRAEDGACIDYIGPKVKRAAGDLLTLAPHAQLRHTIDITRAYAFLPGRHTYTLTLADGVAVTAPAVRFTYTRA